MIDYGIADCEPWADDYHECIGCEEREETLECVRNDLRDVLRILYKGGELQFDDLDGAVDQLCHRVGIITPKEYLVDLYGERRIRI